jgi:glucose/arabinose dehydrogenase
MVLDESVSPPQWKAWASGLRNPIGFDWHPDTGVMYASNNGPDHLGYEQPPESFARLDRGSFHGMPWFQYDGNKINRDDCISSRPPRTDVAKPVATFPARNAPMDVHFINEGHLKKYFHGDAIVALHGSWGTKPHGGVIGLPSSRRPPKLVLVRFEQGKAVRVDDLLTGFQDQKGARLARPMGLGIGPDGVLYITSDGGINGLFRLVPTVKN